LNPKPVFVSLSSVAAAPSTTFWVNGFTTGTRRSSPRDEKRTSRPRPTASRSSSLYATVGLSANPLSFALVEM
jgi:hypothetical protein